MEPGNVAHEVVEAVAGHATGGVHVHAVEALHDVGVIGDLKVGRLRLAEALDLHVAAVVRADGHAGVDHLGDDHHDLVQLLPGLLDPGVQQSHAIGVGLDGSIIRIDLCLDLGLFGLIRALFQLPVQRAVGLAELIALGLQGFGLGHGGALFRVQGNGFVHQG